MSDFQCLVGFLLIVWILGVLLIMGNESVERKKSKDDEQK